MFFNFLSDLEFVIMILSTQTPRKLVVSPALDEARCRRLCEVAGAMRIINCDDPTQAHDAMPDANAFFGKITREMLANCAGSSRRPPVWSTTCFQSWSSIRAC